jgi:hypothetical protein
MQDNEFNDLLSEARRAQKRLDTSRSELFFETRMQSVVRATPQDFGPANRVHTWFRAAAGLAAVTGILAFLVLAGREAIDSEDILAAWWTDNAAAWNLQLFN